MFKNKIRFCSITLCALVIGFGVISAVINTKDTYALNASQVVCPSGYSVVTMEDGTPEIDSNGNPLCYRALTTTTTYSCPHDGTRSGTKCNITIPTDTYTAYQNYFDEACTSYGGSITFSSSSYYCTYNAEVNQTYNTGDCEGEVKYGYCYVQGTVRYPTYTAWFDANGGSYQSVSTPIKSCQDTTGKGCTVSSSDIRYIKTRMVFFIFLWYNFTIK